MTTLVAYKDHSADCIRFGADMRTGYEGHITQANVSKVIQNEFGAVLWSGVSLGMNVLIAHQDEIMDSDNPFQVAQNIKSKLHQYDWLGTELNDGNPREYSLSALFLRASDLSIHSIDAVFATTEITAGFAAEGSGSVYAEGALKILLETPNQITPPEKIAWAIKAAAAFDPNTSEEFIYGEVKRPHPAPTAPANQQIFQQGAYAA